MLPTCEQEGCTKEASHTFLQPGETRRAAVCPFHLPKLVTAAKGMVGHLDIQPIPAEVPEGAKEKTVRDRKNLSYLREPSHDNVQDAIRTLQEHLDGRGTRAVLLLIYNDEDDKMYYAEHGPVTNPELSYAGTQLIGIAHGYLTRDEEG